MPFGPTKVVVQDPPLPMARVMDLPPSKSLSPSAIEKSEREEIEKKEYHQKTTSKSTNEKLCYKKISRISIFRI